MEKELAEVIEENGIMYRLAEDGCYYSDLRLPEGTHYHIGKYGLMRWEYLTANNRREYFRLLMSGKLNKYLHEVDEECHREVELAVKRIMEKEYYYTSIRTKKQADSGNFTEIKICSENRTRCRYYF